MTEDGHERMQQFVDWGNEHCPGHGYIRLWGSFWRPFIIACHPTSMKAILKTAGNTDMAAQFELFIR